MESSDKCEAFTLAHQTTKSTDAFDTKLKTHLPKGAKYLFRCSHREETRSAWYTALLRCSHRKYFKAAWYTVLVWLAEAQSVDEAMQWLSKVVDYTGGNEREEVRCSVTFPKENQRVVEFVHEKYYSDISCWSCNQSRACRGNLEVGDVRPVDLKTHLPLSRCGLTKDTNKQLEELLGRSDSEEDTGEPLCPFLATGGIEQGVKCEAFRLIDCSTVLTNETEFELKLKAQLPKGAKYLFQSKHPKTASYTLLVWFTEAQSVDKAVGWLASVVGGPGGHTEQDLRRDLILPAEDQTANEFVFEIYYRLAFCQNCNQLRACRGNLEAGDIRPVDAKKFRFVAGFGFVFECEPNHERDSTGTKKVSDVLFSYGSRGKLLTEGREWMCGVERRGTKWSIGGWTSVYI